MKFTFKGLLVTLCLGLATPALSLPESWGPIIKPHLPAIVNISTTGEVKQRNADSNPLNIPEWHPYYDLFRPFMDEMGPRRPQKTSSLGSGFIIDPKGIIVTNYHLISEATEILVTLSNREQKENNNEQIEYKAEIIGKDPRTDIALLRIKPKNPLPYVEWGDSDKVDIGDWLIAVGNPFGLNSSVTVGIVSGIARDISGRSARSQNMADFIDGYFQTDASINMGNSGGPAFNVHGKVIGINTAILSSVENSGNIGIAFAIPSNTARAVVEQLLKFGKTKRGWIGVQIQPIVKGMDEAFGLPKPEGALVANITPDGPAARAKIQEGDVILKINNLPVKDSRALQKIVGNTSVGSRVPITVWRNRKEVNLEIQIDEFEKAAEKGLLGPGYVEGDVQAEQKKEQEVLGMTFEEEGSTKAAQKGVKVIWVRPRSQAAQKGVQKGDTILMIEENPINNGAQLRTMINDFHKKGRKHIALQILRDGQKIYLPFKLGEEEEEKNPAKAPIVGKNKK